MPSVNLFHTSCHLFSDLVCYTARSRGSWPFGVHGRSEGLKGEGRKPSEQDLPVGQGGGDVVEGQSCEFVTARGGGHDPKGTGGEMPSAQGASSSRREEAAHRSPPFSHDCRKQVYPIHDNGELRGDLPPPSQQEWPCLSVHSSKAKKHQMSRGVGGGHVALRARELGAWAEERCHWG